MRRTAQEHFHRWRITGTCLIGLAVIEILLAVFYFLRGMHW